MADIANIAAKMKESNEAKAEELKKTLATNTERDEETKKIDEKLKAEEEKKKADAKAEEENPSEDKNPTDADKENPEQEEEGTENEGEEEDKDDVNEGEEGAEEETTDISEEDMQKTYKMADGEEVSLKELFDRHEINKEARKRMASVAEEKKNFEKEKQETLNLKTQFTEKLNAWVQLETQNLPTLDEIIETAKSDPELAELKKRQLANYQQNAQALEQNKREIMAEQQRSFNEDVQREADILFEKAPEYKDNAAKLTEDRNKVADFVFEKYGIPREEITENYNAGIYLFARDYMRMFERSEAIKEGRAKKDTAPKQFNSKKAIEKSQAEKTIEQLDAEIEELTVKARNSTSAKVQLMAKRKEKATLTA